MQWFHLSPVHGIMEFQKFLLVEFISKIQKKIKDVAYFQINTNILIKKGFLEQIDLEKGWLHFAQTLKFRGPRGILARTSITKK